MKTLVSLYKQAIAILLIAMLLPLITFAKSINEWKNVQQLNVNTQVLVNTKNNQSFTGKVTSTTADTIIVSTEVDISLDRHHPQIVTQTVSLQKDEVKEVKELKKRSGVVKGLSHFGAIGLGAMGGFLAGGLAGAGIERSVNSGGGGDDPGLTGLAVGGLIGAVAGAVVLDHFATKANAKEKLIYQAP